MLSRILRVVFALTAIAPLSISIAYVYGSRGGAYQLAIIALVFCFLLGAIALWLIKEAGRRLERLPISIVKAKSSDKEVMGFFLAYVLPLIFKGSPSLDVGAMLLAGGLLLFVLWSTHALQINPVLGVFGYHFYEIETVEGISYLLVTRKRINRLRAIKEVVQLSEYGVLEAAKGKR